MVTAIKQPVKKRQPETRFIMALFSVYFSSYQFKRGGFEMKSVIFSLVFMLGLALTPYLYAEDNTCRLMAPAQDDVWVIVYDADADGNRGKIIWRGKITAGQQIAVASTDGHIRYNFTRDKDQPYEGDIAVGCYQNNNILID
jgi:hypothetical protein